MYTPYNMIPATKYKINCNRKYYSGYKRFQQHLEIQAKTGTGLPYLPVYNEYYFLTNFASNIKIKDQPMLAYVMKFNSSMFDQYIKPIRKFKTVLLLADVTESGISKNSNKTSTAGGPMDPHNSDSGSITDLPKHNVHLFLIIF